LNSWSKYVRRVVTFVVKDVYAKLLPKMKQVIKAKLQAAFDGNNDLITRANLASAMDHCVKLDSPSQPKGQGQLTSKLRNGVEDRYLTNTVQGDRVVIRSSLSLATMKCWLHLVEWERVTYQHLFPPLRQEIPGKAPDKQVTVKIFPNPATYTNYMNAFVGDGANSGGFFYEKENTLYTFQRTARTYFISIEELILHEITHYLNKHYLFRQHWGTAAYKATKSTWLNEGLAEFMSGLNFDARGCYTIPLRENYMDRICRSKYADQYNLEALLASSSKGTFHYQQGYTFIYFLATHHMALFQKILVSFRSNKAIDFAPQLVKLSADWKGAIKDWCSQTKTSLLTKHCPSATVASNPACAVQRHGTRRMKQAIMRDVHGSLTPFG